MTTRRGDFETAALIPGPPAKTGFGGTRPGRSPGFRIVLLPAPSRLSRQWPSAGFVPGYSDGVAAVSHRLPWALVGIPGAFTVKLFECRRDCKPSRRRLDVARS